MDIVLLFILIGVIFATVGAIMLFFREKRKKRCNYKIEGVIVASKRYRGVGDGGIRNFGVCEYEYQGQTYYKTSLIGTTGRPQMDKKKTLFIDPDNPQDCMIDAWASAFCIGVCFVISCMCTVITVVLFAIG